MKGFERMKEMNHGLHGLCSLMLAVWGMSVAAATGTSGEFRMDLSGMGPWEMRTAAASETITYSTAWATNALTDAKAVVKVWPVKREKPKYIAIDLSGGTTATHYPIEYLDEIPAAAGAMNTRPPSLCCVTFPPDRSSWTDAPPTTPAR